MTELHVQAFDKDSKLSPEEQDLLAQRLLSELAFEELWEHSFAKSQLELSTLADNALAGYQRGETKPLEDSF